MRRAKELLRLSRSTAALVTLVLLVGPTRADSQTAPPIALDWDAPAGCPTAPEVLARIRKLAHAWPPTGAPLRAEATITRDGAERLHLRLIVRAGDLVGERNIDAKLCANLASAAAIHVALLLNQPTPLNARDLSSSDPITAADTARSDAAATNTPESSAERAATESEPPGDASAPAFETAREPSSAQPSTRTWRVLVQLPLASLQLGPFPRPSFGVSLAAGVGIGHWRFLAHGRVWLQQKLELKDAAQFGADVDYVDVGARICRAFVWNHFELAPCLRTSVEHVQARGTGAHVAPQTAETTWLAFGLGAHARLYIFEWLSLAAAVDVQLEASQPRILIDGVGSLGKLGPAAVAFTLGSEWIF